VKNVVSYGADATGLSDSTAAWTAALAGGGVVEIPPGTYLLNECSIPTTVDITLKPLGPVRIVYDDVSYALSCFANNTSSAITVTAGSTQPLYSVSGTTIGDPDNQVNRYIAPLPGWVVSVSVVGHVLLSAGNVKYRVRDDGQPRTIGPTATLNSSSALVGSGSRAWATGTYTPTTNEFRAGAILRGIATLPLRMKRHGSNAQRVAEFDTTELERGDTKAMFEAMRVGLGRAGESPILTIEEARQTLRLPRQMPTGDTVPSAQPLEAPEPEAGE
jgi:hypothetical protein